MESLKEGKQKAAELEFTFPVAIPEKLIKVELPMIKALPETPNLLLPDKSYDKKLFIANCGADKYELYDFNEATPGSVLHPVAVLNTSQVTYMKPIALPLIQYGYVKGTKLYIYRTAGTNMVFDKAQPFCGGFDSMAVFGGKGIVHLYNRSSFHIEQFPSFSHITVKHIQDHGVIIPGDAKCCPMFTTSDKHILLGYETASDKFCVLYNIKGDKATGEKLSNLNSIIKNKNRCTMDNFDNLWIGTTSGDIEAYTLDGTKLLSESIGKSVRGITIGEGCLYVHYLGHDRKYHLDQFVIA